MTQTHNLIRDAHVSVIRRNDEKKRPQAVVTVEGQYEHVFPHNSRVSKHLDMMEPALLAERLTGGDFFFIEDQLIDFRDGSYNGFVHSDKTIDVFMDILGYQYKQELKQLTHRQKKHEDDVSSKIILRAEWNKNEINVPGYAKGADFNSILSFQWNPFVKAINSNFDLVRQICTNGMIGLTSFLNTKVPLFNRWEDHLDIAATQIQNKVNAIVIQRIQQMVNERASVGDCILLEDHASTRYMATIDGQERIRLMNIMNAVSPRAQLSGVYRDSVFEDKNLAAQLPAHLSNFDVFNIATELRTHTESTKKSSDFALDKFANSVLFDREDNYSAGAQQSSAPRIAAFASPELAFFGVAA